MPKVEFRRLPCTTIVLLGCDISACHSLLRSESPRKSLRLVNLRLSIVGDLMCLKTNCGAYYPMGESCGSCPSRNRLRRYYRTSQDRGGQLLRSWIKTIVTRRGRCMSYTRNMVQILYYLQKKRKISS